MGSSTMSLERAGVDWGSRSRGPSLGGTKEIRSYLSYFRHFQKAKTTAFSSKQFGIL